MEMDPNGGYNAGGMGMINPASQAAPQPDMMA